MNRLARFYNASGLSKRITNTIFSNKRARQTTYKMRRGARQTDKMHFSYLQTYGINVVGHLGPIKNKQTNLKKLTILLAISGHSNGCPTPISAYSRTNRKLPFVVRIRYGSIFSRSCAITRSAETVRACLRTQSQSNELATFLGPSCQALFPETTRLFRFSPFPRAKCPKKQPGLCYRAHKELSV